jgi:TonB family protein
MPVGNTLYGKADEVARDAKDVKPYAAEGTAPPQRITRPPKCLPLDERERPPYPRAAQTAGIEGLVKLLLTVDAQGRVTSARVLVEPGYGLGDAARSSATRIRCSPGLLEGEPVVSDVTYGYRFTLD